MRLQGQWQEDDGRFSRCARSLAVALVLMVACIPHQPQPGADLAKLLIDLSAMPEDWGITSTGEPPDNIRQHSGASIWFAARTPDLRVAEHSVYRYKSERQAAKEFKRMLPAWFNSSSIASLTPWEPPAELPYISPVAEQFHLACHLNAIKQPAQICQALGQYENYLVVFHTHEL